MLWRCWFGHLACENRPRNDLLCVEWNVKPNTLTSGDGLAMAVSLAQSIQMPPCYIEKFSVTSKTLPEWSQTWLLSLLWTHILVSYRKLVSSCETLSKECHQHASWCESVVWCVLVSRWSFWRRRRGRQWFRWVIEMRATVWFITWTALRVLAASCLSGTICVCQSVDAIVAVVQHVLICAKLSNFLDYEPMCGLQCNENENGEKRENNEFINAN